MQIKQTVCDFCLCRQNRDGSLVDTIEATNWIFTVGKPPTSLKKKKRKFLRSPNKRASGGLPKYTNALCKPALLTGGNRKAGRGAAPGSRTGTAALICLKVVGVFHRRATKACSAKPVGHRARKRGQYFLFQRFEK